MVVLKKDRKVVFVSRFNERSISVVIPENKRDCRPILTAQNILDSVGHCTCRGRSLKSHDDIETFLCRVFENPHNCK